MAFKLRSPLHKENPKFGEIPVASGDKSFGGYQSKLKSQMMSTKNPDDSGVGTYPDPQTGKRTYYDKKHQSYDRKTGVVNKTGSFKDGKYELNKPKPKAKSVLPAGQGGSALNVVGTVIGGAMSLASKKFPKISLLPSTYTPGGGRGIATSGGPEIPAATPGKGSGKVPDLLPAALKPGNNIMMTDAGTNTNAKNSIKPKKTKPKSNTSTSTKKAAKPISSSDSGDRSGGYLKDTKNFSLGVDTKLSTGSMPKLEKTVTNARSADYDMIKAKGRGKIDRLKTRLAKREGRVSNRVEASSMRIKSRQKRSGERYASKMEARTNTGTDPGYLESQKKLDAFEKVMDSPKATPRTSGAGNIKANTTVPKLRTPKSNQTVAKPSMKLNTSKQTSITIDDSKIKKGAKQAKGGGRVSKDTYQNLTGFKKLENKKQGSSKGMRRGVSTANTSIKVPGLSRGPQA